MDAKPRHSIRNKRQINSLWTPLVSGKYADIRMDMLPRSQNRIGKACALVAATLILPILAHAQNPTNPNNPNGSNQNHNPQNSPNQNHNPQNPK
jgi:hypothetical protein